MHFAGRFFSALDQSGMGGELACSGEARNILDLIKDHQCQDMADAGDGADQVIAEGFMDFGFAGQILLEVSELLA